MVREIAIPGTDTLDFLCSAILESIEFDNNHLHSFTYKDRCGKEVTLYHEYCNEGPFSGDVAVQDLPLSIGDSLQLTFDFGDKWCFYFKILKNDPEISTELKTYKILKKSGNPPIQYPEWEE